jgi:hypothetical protein
LPGFVGEKCGTTMDECRFAPCANGATCVSKINGYTCFCAQGFGGTNCRQCLDEGCDVVVEKDEKTNGVTPTVISAKIEEDWTGIRVNFDAPTQLLGSVLCASILDVQASWLGSAACNFVTSNFLFISNPKNDWQIMAGDDLHFLAGKIFSLDQSSNAMQRTKVTLQGPASAPPVVAVLTGLGVLSSCSNLILDTSTSTGSGGRWGKVIFQVQRLAETGLTTSQYDAMDSYMQSANLLAGNRGSSTVTLPNRLFPPGHNYTWSAQAMSWLGGSGASNILRTEKPLGEAPVVFTSPARTTVSGLNQVLVSANVQASLCTGAAKISYLWSQKAGPIYYIDPLVASSKQLVIPAGALSTGNTFEFQVNVTSQPPGTRGVTSTLWAAATVVITILPISAPVLRSAIVSGDAIAISFDVATNQASMWPGSSCDKVITNFTIALVLSNTATAIQCSWVSKTKMLITWTGESAIVLGDAIRVKESVIKAVGGRSRANQMMELKLTAPTEAVIPVVRIQGAEQISSCENLYLDASESSGSAGRQMTGVTWKVADQGTTLASSGGTLALDVLNTQLSSLTGKVLQLPSSSLLTGNSYNFSLTLTNWLGGSSTAAFLVTKSSLALPIMSIIGAKQTISRTQAVNITATATASACIGAQTDSVLELVFTQITTHKFVKWSMPVPPHTTPLMIPGGVLLPGLEYKFRMTATPDNDTTASNFVEASITVAESPVPLPLEARFGDSMARLFYTWSVDTNEPIADGCASVFDTATVAKLGIGAQCLWSRPSIFIVKLGKAFTLSPGDNVGNKNLVLKSADGYSWSALTTSVVVQGPKVSVAVEGILAGPTTVGSCTNIIIDGSKSRGSAGRPLTFKWEVVPSVRHAFTALHAPLPFYCDHHCIFVHTHTHAHTHTHILTHTHTHTHTHAHTLAALPHQTRRRGVCPDERFLGQSKYPGGQYYG